jgi:hypothetical protein
MKLTVTLATPGQAFVWPITVDDLFEMTDVFTTALGQPTVTREGEPYDLDRHIDIRMGSVGEPRREITIEPVTEPSRQPEPISVPEPAPEREPIAVPA